MSRWVQTWIPAALLAAAVLLAAFVTKAALAPALAGPLLLALAVLAADVIDRWSTRGRRVPSAEALFLAGAVLLASALLLPDRDRLASTLPILGATVAVLPLRRGDTCRRAALPR